MHAYSTQQLKGLVVASNLKLTYSATVDFDADLAHYGIHKGVLTNPSEGEIYAPTAMWLEAFDLVLRRLKEDGLDFGRVKGVSGAGMQHGTVFWGLDAEKMLGSLNPKKTLLEQLGKGEHAVFSHPHSPNWQDASTQKQCDMFDQHLGSPEKLAEVTGSKAHHRFSGPQILRFRTKYPDHYSHTSRISLVSSFVASIFLGRVAPIDIGDAGGMNLWDIHESRWHEGLLELCAGSRAEVATLRAKLGDVRQDGGGSIGSIASYFVKRFGFASDCNVVPCTGDNPSTILALPLRASDAMVSLGTSTTFLMSTPQYKPDPAYHFMNHPTTPGLYMFMLCYKNGGLARENVRDALNTAAGAPAKSWDLFDKTATQTPPMHRANPDEPQRMGLFFPRPEIVPNVQAGTWRYLHTPATGALHATAPRAGDSSNRDWPLPETDARAILESQFLSLRLRSQALVAPQTDPATGAPLPAQPRRIYLVGGGSQNAAIARVCGEVLGAAEGVYRLDIGGNACALGAAYKAVWGVERASPDETFETLIGQRWREDEFVKKIAGGYKQGVWEEYAEAVPGFDKMEREVVDKYHN
jgi:xylulokinase